MAEMEIGSEINECQEKIDGRALRKRPSNPPVVTKRRKSECSPKISDEISVADVYRQDITKIANFQPSSLETIYESPRGKTNFLKDFMGIVKLKRQCRFSAFYDPPKLKMKQRKTKARSLKRIGGKSLSAKFTFEQVEQALKEISGDEDEENNSTFSNSKLFAKDWCYQGNIITPDNSFQAVNDLTSTLAGMDMSSWNCKEEYNINTSDPLLFEHFDRKNNVNKYEDTKDVDLLIPSPSGVKSKKDRRRSGRVPPRVLEEPMMDTFSDSQCKAPVKEPSIKSEFCTSSIAIISDSASFGNKIYSSSKKPNNSDIETSNKNLRILKKSTVRAKKPLRRTSGIRRPLYHSVLNYSNELDNSSPLKPSEIMPNPEMDLSPHGPQPLNKTGCTSSPTSLFGSLKISSPGSMTLINNKVNKTQRRSARLSSGGLHMGSLWTGSKKNKIDFHSFKEPFDDFNTPLSNPHNEYCNDVNLPTTPKNSSLISNSSLKSNLIQKRPSRPVNLDVTDGFSETVTANFSEHSPVVSGMFNSKARIFNGEKYVVQESNCSFNLIPFKPARL